MRTTPIGIAMLNDERPHVYQQNNPANVEVVKQSAHRSAEPSRPGLGLCC